MSLTPVVKQRLAQGQTAAGGAYVELIDMDEVERLTDAYLTLNDGKHVPEQQPPPLTPQDFKRYVRLVHDALKSTDLANDAFKVNKDGITCKTPPMNYIDALKMFEIQLVAGNLVKTVHGAQSGTIRTPSWLLVNGVKFHKYSTFPERMDKVILALKTWKSFGKALFLDFVPMEKRLAIRPEEETTKKGFNKSNNGNRDVELQFARRNMPKAEEPAAAADDEDEDEDADNDGNPGPVSKKRRRGGNPDSVTINPGVHRGNNRGVKKQAAAQDVLADMRSASQGLDDRSRFPGPLENSMRQYGNQRPQMAGPSTIQRPLPSGERLLPQQPQPTHLPSRSSPQQYPPPPDYVTSQRATFGSQQSSLHRGGIVRENDAFQMQGTQGSVAQGSPHSQAVQQKQFPGFQLGGTASGSHHNDQGGLQHREMLQQSGRIVGNEVAGVRQNFSRNLIVHNHFPAPIPAGSSSQALPSPQGAFDQALGNNRGRNYFENLDDNQAPLNVVASGPPASPQGNLSSDFPTVNLKMEQQDQAGSPLPALHPPNSPLPAALPASAADGAPEASSTVRPNEQISWPDLAPVASPPGGIWGDEDVYQMYVQMGIAPHRAGNVFDGELRTMFRTPSPRQESSEAETEEEDDDDDDDESDEDSDDELKQDSDDELKSESKDEVKEESDVKVKFEEDSNDGS